MTLEDGEQSLGASPMEDYSLLVIACPRRPLTASDIACTHHFVATGGSLLVLAEAGGDLASSRHPACSTCCFSTDLLGAKQGSRPTRLLGPSHTLQRIFHIGDAMVSSAHPVQQGETRDRSQRNIRIIGQKATEIWF